MSDRPVSVEERQLLDALRVFVKTDPPAKSKEEKVKPSDVLCVLGAVIGLSLLLALIPIAWKSSDFLKQIFENVLPWALNLSTIGAILKSPEAVLQVARKPWVRWSVAFGVPALAIFVIQVFRVDPRLVTPANVFVDGSEENNLRDGPFRLNLWFHEITLRTEWGDRRIAVNPVTLIRGDLSNPLRPLHGFKIAIQDNDVAICVQPKGFTFDEEFLAREGDRYQRAGSQAVERVTTDEGQVTLVLPAGDYNVTGHRQNCGLAGPIELRTDSSAEAVQRLDRVTCKTPVAPNPCDHAGLADTKRIPESSQ